MNKCTYLFSVILAASMINTYAAEPAVDGLNTKISAQVGSDNFSAIEGSITLPAGNNYGFQVDLAAVRTKKIDYDAIGGHFFQRDPDSYLLGLTAGYNTGDFGRLSRFGVEAEKYLQNITLQGRVGYQTGKYFGFEHENTFYRVGAKWYVTDDFAVNVRQTSAHNGDATSFGVEWQPRYTESTGYSFFAEFNRHKHQDWNNIVGVRVYLDRGKTLKSRHRTGDPEPEAAYSQNVSGCPKGTYPLVWGDPSWGCAPSR